MLAKAQWHITVTRGTIKKQEQEHNGIEKIASGL